MANDLGFLLIFIILPTALIVSGFWLFLFIRRDTQRREVIQPDNQVEPATMDGIEELAATELSEEAVAVSGQTDADESQDTPPPVFAPDTAPADATAQPDTQNEEFWSPEPAPLAPQHSEPASHEILAADSPASAGSTAMSADDEETIGHTEEITPVHTPEPASASTSGSEIATSEAAEEEVKSETVSGDTANLPEDWEVDLDDEKESEEEDDSRRRRQPEARMVPATENVQRRTGLSNRRVPPIGRSTGREEDPVERPDGS